MKQILKKIFSPYRLGQVYQVLFLVFIIVMIVTAFTTGFDLGEFRYVGY